MVCHGWSSEPVINKIRRSGSNSGGPDKKQIETFNFLQKVLGAQSGAIEYQTRWPGANGRVLTACLHAELSPKSILTTGSGGASGSLSTHSPGPHPPHPLSCFA